MTGDLEKLVDTALTEVSDLNGGKPWTVRPEPLRPDDGCSDTAIELAIVALLARVAELERGERFLAALITACNSGREITFAQGAGDYSLNIIDGELPVRVCDIGLPELALRLTAHLSTNLKGER